MNAFAGLMNPAQIGQDIQIAFQSGREMAKRQQAESALSAYAANPDDEAAFQGLAKYAPEYAITVSQARQKAKAKAYRRDVRMRAARGDAAAKLELWGDDPDIAMKLDKQQLEKAAEGIDFIADAAYQIVKMPEEQRATAWDQYLDRGVQMGFDGLAQYKGKYSPESLNAVVARAGEMKEFQEAQDPRYVAAPEGAGLINVRDPAAIQQWNSGVQSQPTTKTINGNTYYQVNGKWYDELPGGSVGDGTGGF